MSDPRHGNWPDPRDMLLGFAGVAWILGFVAAIETALDKLLF